MGAKADGSDGDEDTPENKPETDPKAKPEDKPKQGFTQEDVNRLVAAERKKLEAKLASETAERNKLTEQLKAIQSRLDDKDKNDPSLKTEEGRIEAIQRKHARVEEDFNKRLADITAKAELAEKRRLETLRDRSLDEALVTAGCIDLKAGRRYFLPDITKHDPEDNTELDDWALKSPSGKLVDIATGVSEHLPKYLRGATANVGGAGTMNTSTKQKERDQLKALEAEVETLRQKAHQAGPHSDAILIEYSRKSAQLKKLKAAGAKT